MTASVTNAPDGLDYASDVLPAEGALSNVVLEISAQQWLTVPKADFIKCSAIAAYKTLSVDASIAETKGSAKGDYVTLAGYDGKTCASASQVYANQTLGIETPIRIISILYHSKCKSSGKIQ